MFETTTFETILARMLSAVPSDFDKREGSVIYDALAPAAVELQNMYIALDTVLTETFADTASRDSLIKRAAERGITPYAATRARIMGEFNVKIPLGSRFSVNGLIFKAVSKVTDYAFILECETEGTEGNGAYGNLIPIDYIAGLTTAVVTEIISPGQDAENTEHLRVRYLDSLSVQSFAGNIAAYKEKTSEIEGVGGVKVYPVWNGGGTVKLVITDSTYNVPSAELVRMVQTIIDPEGNNGEGKGTAPIGHVVTVGGVKPEIIDIWTNVILRTGWQYEDVKPYIEQVLDDYFAGLSEQWSDNEYLTVRISYIESAILSIEAVLDVQDTKICGKAENYVLDMDSIPVRGEVDGTATN